MSEMFIQLTPSLILGLIYAALVFTVARKRGVNPWPWTIGTVIPLVGLIVSAVFFFVTLLSMLDRLNALEAKAVTNTFD